MIIAFSFLSLLDKNYKESIIKFNSLDNNNWLHYDVMDGKFVSNSTFSCELIKEVSNYNTLFNDVHLMIDDPLFNIDRYINTGADMLTFHYEASYKEDIIRIIEKVKNAKLKVGISIKPSTSINVLDEYLPYLDYVLIMSVEPGKGGQQFMESCIEKIKYLKNEQSKHHYLIGVDGGINDKTSKLVKLAGADVVVIGSYLANNLTKETILNCK